MYPSSGVRCVHTGGPTESSEVALQGDEEGSPRTRRRTGPRHRSGARHRSPRSPARDGATTPPNCVSAISFAVVGAVLLATSRSSPVSPGWPSSSGSVNGRPCPGPLLNREGRLLGRVRPGSTLCVPAGCRNFAFGWAPCIGPVLATILTAAAATETVIWGAIPLTMYSIVSVSRSSSWRSACPNAVNTTVKPATKSNAARSTTRRLARWSTASMGRPAMNET